MGTYISKNEDDDEYTKIVIVFNNLIYGLITINECHIFLKTNPKLIKNNFYKLIIKNPKLITKLIKVYPEIRIYILNILDKEEFRFLSNELEIYNL